MKEITFELNGKIVTYSGNMTNRLLDVLRNEYNINSVKCACKDGKCGTCGIIVNNLLTNSCMVAIGSINNSKVYTLEYYKDTNIYKELINIFDKYNLTCKYSLSGLLITLINFLMNNPKPTKEEIRISISGNMLRNISYNSIIDDVYELSRKEVI